MSSDAQGPRKPLTTVLALGGGVFLFRGSMLRLDTQLTGVSGQFVAARREVSESHGARCPSRTARGVRVARREVSESHGADDWKCGGSFRADDDSFRIPGVEVDTVFETKPTGLVPVVVEDESSTTAVEKDYGVWLWPGATGLLCLGMGAWNVRLTLRRPKQRDPVAAPAGSPTAAA